LAYGRALCLRWIYN